VKDRLIPRQVGGIAQIPYEVLGVGIDVVTRNAVVEHPNLVATLNQGIYKVTSHESATPGDKNLHLRPSALATASPLAIAALCAWVRGVAL